MSTRFRWFELASLYALIPLIVWQTGGLMFAFLFLWLALSGMGLYLTRQKQFSWRAEWNAAAVNKGNVQRIIFLLIPAFVLMVLLVYWLHPSLTLRLVQEKPLLLLAISVIYPIVSVLPQEVIYRSFFFNRYGQLLGKTATVLLSALSFGLVHIIFGNWIAPILSSVGGMMFAYTYHKSRSLALVSLEHALYGIAIFASGLGVYFYRNGAAILAQLG